MDLYNLSLEIEQLLVRQNLRAKPLLCFGEPLISVLKPQYKHLQ